MARQKHKTEKETINQTTIPDFTILGLPPITHHISISYQGVSYIIYDATFYPHRIRVELYESLSSRFHGITTRLDHGNILAIPSGQNRGEVIKIKRAPYTQIYQVKDIKEYMYKKEYH